MSSTSSATTAEAVAACEHEYSVQSAELTATLARLPLQSPQHAAHSLAAAAKTMQELCDVVEQAEVAARDISDPAERGRVLGRLRNYKRDREALAAELRSAEARFGQQDASGSSSREQLARVVDDTERLERSSRRLEDSERLLVETEQVGAQTLADLEEQRSTITRARSRLVDTGTDLGRSGRVLNAMAARVVQHRLALYAVAALLTVMFIVFVYFKLSDVVA